MIRRRELLALAGAAGAAAAWPMAGRAQQAKVPLLIVLSAPLLEERRQAILAGLADYGYDIGRNIVVEFVAAPTDPEMPAVAALALSRHPDIILVVGAPAIRALQAAGAALPIVFTSVIDPVLLGVVPSLAHPSGNMTGNTILGANLAGKALELLREMVPKVSRIALFETSDTVEAAVLREQLGMAGDTLGINFAPINVRNVGEDFAPYYAQAKATGAQAIFMAGYLVTSPRQGAALYDLALANGWPTLATTSGNLESGGLFSYGANNPAVIRRSIYYVDAILKGAKPGDLAVELPTVFELVVNLRTAKALGIIMPTDVLFRADRVIE